MGLKKQIVIMVLQGNFENNYYPLRNNFSSFSKMHFYVYSYCYQKYIIYFSFSKFKTTETVLLEIVLSLTL